MRKSGSITVYMSLIFSVILALIAGSLQSVRTAYARVLTASAAEQGLYSIFSRFDPALLEEYELFFLDGGCGTGRWQPGNLYQTAEDTCPGFWERKKESDIGQIFFRADAGKRKHHFLYAGY